MIKIKSFCLVLLLLAPPEIHAAGLWKKLFCRLIVDDPYQFETVSNEHLVQYYLQHAVKAFFANRTDSTLKVAGDQLRVNHDLGQPLTEEQLQMLENYKYLEAEMDGITPKETK